jgi:hypothetical protein
MKPDLSNLSRALILSLVCPILCLNACSLHAAVDVFYNHVDTPDMPGWLTYTLIAVSSESEPIIGVDFFGDGSRDFAGGLGGSSKGIWSAGPIGQDSQFLLPSSAVLLVASKGPNFMQAAFFSPNLSPGFGTVFPFARVVVPEWSAGFYQGEFAVLSTTGDVISAPVQGIFNLLLANPPIAVDENLGDRPRGSTIDYMFHVNFGDRPFTWDNLVVTAPGPPAIAPVLNSNGTFTWDTANSPLGLYTFDATVSNPHGIDIASLTLNLVQNCDLTPGLCQSNPTLPNMVEPGVFFFNSVPSGQWFDPPAVEAFEYVVLDGTLFSQILDFPTGFSDLFTVSVGGNVLGQFGPGQSVDFVSLLGGGVSEFTVSGINPLVDAEDPLGFPLQIAFTTPTGSFAMRAVVPEPTGFGIVLSATGWILLWRGRQAARIDPCPRTKC